MHMSGWAGRDRLQEASRRAVHKEMYTKGCTRCKAYGLTVPVVYVPNHEVVGLSVVGLGTSMPKMRWVVYDPPIRQGPAPLVRCDPRTAQRHMAVWRVCQDSVKA